MRHLLSIPLLIFALSCHAAGTQLRLNGTTLDVALAVTDEEHRHGLMGITELKEGQGMLFVYDEPQLLYFWMKETLIPLDILFFNGDGQLLEFFSDLPPCKVAPCKTYGNRNPAQYVLELAAGTSQKLKLKRGDVFTIVPH